VSRFTDEDVVEMRERWRRGESVYAIAVRFEAKWDTAAGCIFGRWHKSAPLPVTADERATRRAA
jgi:hypothetical protein